MRPYYLTDALRPTLLDTDDREILFSDRGLCKVLVLGEALVGTGLDGDAAHSIPGSSQILGGYGADLFNPGIEFPQGRLALQAAAFLAIADSFVE
jgi:hypothetical protein